MLGALYGTPVLSIVSAGLAVYLVVGAVTDILQRATFRASSARVAFTRLFGLPLSAWGTSISHAGMGLTLLGLAATGWGVEKIISMKPGDPVTMRGLTRSASNSVDARQGPNYSEIYAGDGAAREWQDRRPHRTGQALLSGAAHGSAPRPAS